MRSFFSTATLDDPRISLRDDGILPPIVIGGGDSDSRPEAPDYATRLRRARLGLLVAVIPIFMLFVSFTSAYLVRQGLPTLDPRTNTLIRDWIPITLPKLLLINTGVLVLSTLFMELARRQIRNQVASASITVHPPAAVGDQFQIPWLFVTFAFGLAFLFGQWTAWRQLAASGYYMATTPSSSFVYLLTGTHAIHLIGGVLALLGAGVASLLHRSVTTRSIVVDVTAWYWHFMTAVWIYIFCLMEFAGGAAR
jgi:cytochrome c oxidase subunit III